MAWGAVAGSSGCYLGWDAAPGEAPPPADGVESSSSGGATPAETHAETGSTADVGVDWHRPDLRRLTGSQHAACVDALLGAEPPVSPLPPDLMEDGSFSTVGASVVVSGPSDVEAYERAALLATQAVFSDPSRREGLVGCDVTDNACVEEFVEQFGRRAWRRALSVAERERYTDAHRAFVDDGATEWEALRLVAAAFLQSPNFLYLVEVGEPKPDDPTVRRYTSYEMATRLSFALSGRPPDDAMLDAAEAEQTRDPAWITEYASTTLAENQARAALEAYFDEAYELDAIAKLAKDPALFPAANPQLMASMRAELRRMLVDSALSDAPWLDVLQRTTTYVDDALADLYGIDPATIGPRDAAGLGEAEYPAERIGLLGAAGLLALGAKITRTSPTARGLFVRRRLLCQAIPDPPPSADVMLPDTSEDARTMRERLARHADDATCAGCHRVIDPLGLALERFDALGVFRRTDDGVALDLSGTLDGEEFDGLDGLSRQIARHPMVGPCAAMRYFTYVSGHEASGTAQQHLDDLARAWLQDDGRFSAWIVAAVTSPVFSTKGGVE